MHSEQVREQLKALRTQRAALEAEVARLAAMPDDYRDQEARQAWLNDKAATAKKLAALVADIKSRDGPPPK